MLTAAALSVVVLTAEAEVYTRQPPPSHRRQPTTPRMEIAAAAALLATTGAEKGLATAAAVSTKMAEKFQLNVNDLKSLGSIFQCNWNQRPNATTERV